MKKTPYIIAATGHRPDNLGGHSPRLDGDLRRLALWYFADKRPDAVVSGMALGWDMAVAEAALELKIPLVAAVPFPLQAAKWSEADRYRYSTLLSLATHVETVRPYFTPSVLQKRNEWMIDHASHLVALWDGTPSGTGNCVRYGLGKIPMDNLWPVWQAGTF